MMNDNSDNSDEKQYNKEDEKIVEKIDLNNLKQVNDTEHEHNWIRDAEETGTYYAMRCTHPRCHRGFLVSKDVNQM